MKLRNKNIASFLALIFLFVTILAIAGCATQKPDPLAGFHWCSLGKLDANEEITDDYKSYIEQLSPEETKYMGPTEFFRDGKGWYAVRIETDINGTDAWYHILFYDKDNKRIKVVKYYRGRYRS